MHVSFFASPLLSGLFMGCHAYPNDPHVYIPPTESDSRSPCPGLNALANQGYIPRDGRNIDPVQLAEAMLEVMNLQIAPFQSEIDTTLAHSTTGNSSTFNLEDSNVHNDIEIDGSLSRKDLYFGDNIHFDQAIWDQSSSKFEGDIITIRTAAESRRYRTQMAEVAGSDPVKELRGQMNEQTSSPAIDGTAPALLSLQVYKSPEVALTKIDGQNPTYTPIPFIAGLAPAIYMLVFGGVNATHTQRAWIESFFRDRLPTHLGWTKSPVELTQDDLFAMSSTIAAVPVAIAKP